MSLIAFVPGPTVLMCVLSVSRTKLYKEISKDNPWIKYIQMCVPRAACLHIAVADSVGLIDSRIKDQSWAVRIRTLMVRFVEMLHERQKHRLTTDLMMMTDLVHVLHSLYSIDDTEEYENVCTHSSSHSWCSNSVSLLSTYCHLRSLPHPNLRRRGFPSLMRDKMNRD